MSELFEKGYEYEKQGDYVNVFNTYLQVAEERWQKEYAEISLPLLRLSSRRFKNTYA